MSSQIGQLYFGINRTFLLWVDTTEFELPHCRCVVSRRYYTFYGVWVWRLYRAIDRIGWNPTTWGLEAIWVLEPILITWPWDRSTPFAHLKQQIPDINDNILFFQPFILDDVSVNLESWSGYNLLAQHPFIVILLTADSVQILYSRLFIPWREYPSFTGRR